MKTLGSPGNAMDEAAEMVLHAFSVTRGPGATYEASIGSVVSPVHRGVESACYNVDAAGSEFFLKIRYPDMADLFDETVVHAGARRASDLAVGACLVDAHEKSGSYLFERLDENWRWGKVDDFRDPSVLENTVIAKKKIHGGDALPSGRSVFDTIEYYRAIVEAENIKVPKTSARVLEKVRECAKALAAAGISPSPAHGDGVASNIMIAKSGEVCLVDFDSTGNHDPYFDLGSLIVEITQFPEVARAVLEIYDGQCRDAQFGRCMLYGIADDLKWALWGFISFARSSRSHVEFVKYAEWRMLRALFNAEGPDFDRWMAKL
ncbi:phosphotransferase [Hoeflea prorocentri]|uniref:Phosphotransferase n=1 Tax=Hoeflea prorocentri TaxID=1922333 RepID=A0A9X3UF60_9HYPH|nr:phosphotransferase [Hoeflea prorocentri]MCY6379612.1 phosphotransferase [Hoeflea prorocentri]MDA5397412.1 phosphotransferase [Hoeflea prorocentri]